MLLIYRTAEAGMGKGERKQGDKMQQRAAGRSQTHGHCRGLTASVHGAYPLPAEQPSHQGLLSFH